MCVYYTESLRVSTTTRYLQTCVSIIQSVCASPLPHPTYKHVMCIIQRVCVSPLPHATYKHVMCIIQRVCASPLPHATYKNVMCIIQRVCASPLPRATYKHVCLLYREFARLHYHTLPTNMCVYYTESLRVSTTTRYLQTCDVYYTESLRVSTTTRYLHHVCL